MKKTKKNKAAKKMPRRRGITRLDLSILLTAGLLLLERLPKGIVMRFSDGEQYYTEYCSYFDLLPFGYGDFFPLITGVLSVMLVLVLLGSRFWNKVQLQKGTQVLAYLTFGAAVTALFMGIRFSMVTVIRVLVPVLSLGIVCLLSKRKTEE